MKAPANPTSRARGASESRVRQLSIAHIFAITRVMYAAFQHDSAFMFMVRTHLFRAIVLRYWLIMSILTSFIAGRVDGLLQDDSLVGVALWLPPKRFPPPWYVTVILVPFVYPLLLVPAPTIRMSAYQKAQNHMVPKDVDLWWYLGGLSVRPEHQGRGVGSELLRSGVSIAADAGHSVALSCWTNEVPYYRKHGFDVIDTTTPVGKYQDALHLMIHHTDPTALADQSQDVADAGEPQT